MIYVFSDAVQNSKVRNVLKQTLSRGHGYFNTRYYCVASY